MIILLVSAVLSALLTGANSADGKPATAAKKQATLSRCSAGFYALQWQDPAILKAPAIDFIVLQPWEHAYAREIKRKHPKSTVVMYKNLSAVRKDSHENGMYSTGVSYGAAQEEWFLKDDSGEKLQLAHWPELYLVNTGIKAYQQQWVANTAQDLKRGPWDGVMLDDVFTSLERPTVANRKSTAIPNDSAQTAATGKALKFIGKKLKKKGYGIYPNLTDVHYDDWKRHYRSWSPLVAGWVHEFFVRWPNGKRFKAGDDWLWKYKLARWANKKKIPFYPITYAPRKDRATQLYHRATWLLAWNGKTGGSVFTPEESGVNHHRPLAYLSPGKPKNKAKRLKSGVYSRAYSGGRVLVNPTSKPITVSFGKFYFKPSGKKTKKIRLKPARAAVLFKNKRALGSCRN